MSKNNSKPTVIVCFYFFYSITEQYGDQKIKFSKVLLPDNKTEAWQLVDHPTTVFPVPFRTKQELMAQYGFKTAKIIGNTTVRHKTYKLYEVVKIHDR